MWRFASPQVDSPDNHSNAAELEFLRVDASFNLLLAHISLLHNQSTSLLENMQRTLGDSFLTEFHTEL